MRNRTELGTRPIGQLLAKFSIPAVIAMLVNAIYNVVDRMFVGKLVGEEALAGLTITFPIMMILFSFAGLIAIGGAVLLSIRIGEQDYKEASHVFGSTLTLGFLVNTILVLLFLIKLDWFLRLFGAIEEVLVYAKAYLKIILGGLIFQMGGFILSNFVRTEGRPMYSMTVMIVSAVMNIILDYIFIGHFHMGVQGAAYGTIISQFIGLILYLLYYLRGNSNVHLNIRDFVPNFKMVIKIITIGMASFISTIGTSIAMIFLNRSLGQYGGTAGITSLGAINSLYTFFIMPIMGITQGIQPIIGYNHGAKQKGRVYDTLKLSIIIGSTFSTLVFIILELFAPFFVGLFLERGSSTIPVAAVGLRIFIAMLPLLSINLMGVAFFQSTDQGKISTLLGMSRQFIFLLPLLFVLPSIWGLNGVWIATPISDGLAILLTIIILLNHKKNDKIKNNEKFDNVEELDYEIKSLF